jgi:glycosyltransferase involved in cell wall biosynthesis
MLADSEPPYSYWILVNEMIDKSWTYRHWPTHIQFASLNSVEPKQSVQVRVERMVRKLLGLSVPPHYGGAYIASQIDALGLDLLHYPRTTIWPLSINTPCVLTFFDMQHEFYPQFFTQKELDRRGESYRSSVEKAEHLIVPSQYTQQTLIEKYDVPVTKMTLVPVGLPRSFHRVELSEVERIRNKYNLPERFVYYPANPWLHKNHARLMSALRIYGERYGEVPWLVLSGRLHNERRDAGSLAIAAGVSERVIDLEFVAQEDLPGLYSAASLMVFPSLFEGFGIPLVEAMGCGCPIAAADATAIPECVGKAALLFDPWDPADIADKIYHLLVDEKLRQLLVKRGYERAQQFDWRSITEQLAKVYAHALQMLPKSQK